MKVAEDQGSAKKRGMMCSIRTYGAGNAPSLEPVVMAVLRVLKRLHAIPQPLDLSLTAHERNQVIKARFEAGESQANLARIFGISYQRIHQIIRGKYH